MSVEALPISSGGKPIIPQDKPAFAAKPSEYSANSGYFLLRREYEYGANLSEFNLTIREILMTAGLIAIALLIYRCDVIIFIKRDNGKR
ncbi:hypothetical protein [Serratia marcescens]|uniref:hypothetical protein n=1 Tax=Serratia marcescens TaxID=615 RepID=UPI0027E5A980|nr:hypothetical protein [Serratia marcescens]